MIRKILVSASLLMLSFLAQAQSGPSDIRPVPKEYQVKDGVAVWPFRVVVDLGDRDLRRRVYHLPDYAHKAAYEITVGADGARISAVTVEALDHAKTSLAQMVAVSDSIRYCHVLDYPGSEFRVRHVDLNDGGAWDVDRLILYVDFAHSEKQNILRIDGDPRSFSESDIRRLTSYADSRYVSVEWVPDGGRRVRDLDVSALDDTFGSIMEEIDRMASLKANVLVLRNASGLVSDGQLANIVRYAASLGVIVEEHNH